MKIRPVGAEVFHADGRTGQTDRQTDWHDESKSRFLHFSDRAKMFSFKVTKVKCNGVQC